MLQIWGYRDYAVILQWFYSDFTVIYINQTYVQWFYGDLQWFWVIFENVVYGVCMCLAIMCCDFMVRCVGEPGVSVITCRSHVGSSERAYVRCTVPPACRLAQSSCTAVFLPVGPVVGTVRRHARVAQSPGVSSCLPPCELLRLRWFNGCSVV